MNMAEQPSSNRPPTSTPDTLEPHLEVPSFKVYKPAGSQAGPTPLGTHLILVTLEAISDM